MSRYIVVLVAFALCIACLSIVSCTPSVLAAQPHISWEKTYGGSDDELGDSVQQTSDGGFIVAGTTLSYGNDSEVYLVRTDASGKELWSKAFGGKGKDFGHSVCQTSDSGFIVAGTSDYLTIDSRIYLIKTDAGGNEQWQMSYGVKGINSGESVAIASDGGYMVVGSSMSPGSELQVYLVKTDSSGRELWNRTYGGNMSESGASLQATADGGYIIAGRAVTDGDSRKMLLIKTDANGNEQWSQTYGGSMNQEAGCVRQVNDGGYIVAGFTISFGNMSQVYAVKTDANGNEQWNKTYGGDDFEEGYSALQTRDGGYLFTGNTWKYDNASGAYVVKTDANGDEQWHLVYGSDMSDDAYSAVQADDGGYVITGRMNTTDKGPQLYLIKVMESSATGTSALPASPSIATGSTLSGASSSPVSHAAAAGSEWPYTAMVIFLLVGLNLLAHHNREKN